VITKTENIPDTADRAVLEQAPQAGQHLKAVALRAYSGHKHRVIGNDEIIELLPLVRTIARRTVRYLRPPLSFDDLASAGTVGLLKAARDFDPSRQAEFKTYAYIRIKGAILDELRRASLLPSSVNRQVRHALKLSQEMTQQTGSAPTDEQLAEKLGVSVDEVYTLFENARAQHFVSLDEACEELPALGTVLAAADSSAPDNRIQKAEVLQKLTEAMAQLDQRRLQIIVLYYHKHLTMKQIADLFEITESRVSQLHASALVNLAAMLGEYHNGGQ
jgi:RNA polymerase sigma factor for flagellar operon FliA